MSAIDLQVVKNYCLVTHNEDDNKLQLLLNAAETQAIEYLNWADIYGPGESSESETSSDSSSESVSHSINDIVVQAVCALVDSQYDDYSQESRNQAMKAFERALYPLRVDIGV